jgi:hypothetical protein
MEWYAARGATKRKVCAKAGDLILWDSRVVHWNEDPTGSRTRLAAYVCYCPRRLVAEDVLSRRVQFFYARTGTNHKPFLALPGKDCSPRLAEPEETDTLLRLIGSGVDE